MKRYIIILGLFVILTSCLAKISRHNSIFDESLHGYWSFEGVTWLKITKDSIYFVDEEAYPVKYSVKNDTIVWYFDGIIRKDKYKIVQDTLFMENEEGTATYIRCAQPDYVGYVNRFYDTMYEQRDEKGIETISVGGDVYTLKDLCFNKSKDDFISTITGKEVYSFGYHFSSILELRFNDGSSLYYEVWSDYARADNYCTYDYEIVEIYNTEGESLSSKGVYLKCGAVINDPDGYVNVRSGKSAKSKVVAKIAKDQTFLYTPSSKSSWWRVYLKDGGECVGYVYKDKILPYRKCNAEIRKKIEHEMNCDAH